MNRKNILTAKIDKIKSKYIDKNKSFTIKLSEFEYNRMKLFKKKTGIPVAKLFIMFLNSSVPEIKNFKHKEIVARKKLKEFEKELEAELEKELYLELESDPEFNSELDDNDQESESDFNIYL